MWAEIVQWLKSIPDVVWSGLIASVLTLSGVLISNWSNSNRLKLQLRHDSTEKARDRAADLRREVYLEAAEELVKAQSHFGSLAGQDLTKVNAGEALQPFFAAATKLQIVAEHKTALLVNNLVAHLGELYFKVLARIAPMQSLRSKIQISDKFYQEDSSQCDRILSEMRRMSESGRSDRATFDALDRSLKFHRSQVDKHAAERNSAYEQLNRAHLEFLRFLMPELQLLGEKQMPVMVEIRCDLGLATDIVELEERMREQRKRMAAQFEAFTRQMEANLDRQSSGS